MAPSSIEERLLLACARGERPAAPGGLDWDRLLSYAARQRLMPALCWGLGGSDGVPMNVGERLRRAFQETARRNLLLAGELLELLELFAGRGVRAIPFKGPVLAAALYGDLARREFFDLDLLIRLEDLGAAQEVLESRGYRLTSNLNWTQQANIRKWNFELLFARDDGCSIEIGRAHV